MNRQDVYDMVASAHNMNLAKNDGDMVCHIYNDGEITLEKGGYLYGNRTRHTTQMQICPSHIFAISKFPIVEQDFGYAVTTYENAIKIRNDMKEVYSEILKNL